MEVYKKVTVAVEARCIQGYRCSRSSLYSRVLMDDTGTSRHWYKCENKMSDFPYPYNITMYYVESSYLRDRRVT